MALQREWTLRTLRICSRIVEAIFGWERGIKVCFAGIRESLCRQVRLGCLRQLRFARWLKIVIIRSGLVPGMTVSIDMTDTNFITTIFGTSRQGMLSAPSWHLEMEVC